VVFEPYTASHVITQLQLLMFSALAFAVLMRTGLYPPELRSLNLDSDWIYRRAMPAIIRAAVAWLTVTRRNAIALSSRLLDRFMVVVFHFHGPQGVLARTWPIGSAAIWVLALLAGFLIFYYV
jgi:multicomponent Na+:H+ antiporter subunit D